MSEHFQDLGGGYFRVVIHLREQCTRCQRYISPHTDIFDREGVWSHDKTATHFDWQQWASRLGSINGHDVGVVCKDCKSKEPPKPPVFICDGCEQERAMNLLVKTVDDAQFCAVCYETMSAKEWDERIRVALSAYTGHEWD